ncbi:VOC family protein [Lapillicoccus jejuensis]|uniref:Glyoxalase-like domain-containing protein n=1 Tax=Lapillicoccus jejuensis TaxID=402171 RepID=A0A542DYN7_9MICO|nr:VOC family protein [Lapillicoccus jejuensis]TQJ08213.1 hypothetical protein FB458_1297 [Lapillicoccus jejuensis]
MAEPLASYKDLCLDAADPVRLGTFYAAALGLRLERLDDGDVVLRGDTPEHTVWVNRVPEPKTVWHRLHLDVNVAAVDDLLALGASVVDDTQPWTVLRDPEGGELCAFVRAPEVLAAGGGRGRPLYELVLQVGAGDDGAAAAAGIAHGWAGLVGGRVEQDPDEGYSWVEGIPGAPFENLVITWTDEPKTVKNRVHLDVTCRSVDDLVAYGARVLAPGGAPGAPSWTVLADPAGNELCAFPG